MSTERVDKMWQHKGLGAYSTEAIFGTLRHYGVSGEEEAVRALLGDAYPLEAAELWDESWKGTGKFARYHWAAAEELTRRFHPDRLVPGELGRGLVDLMTALAALLDGEAEAPVGPAFAKVAELRGRVPLVEGKPDPRFTNEVAFRLGDWMKVFGEIAQDLAKKGHVDDAERFAELEAFLFPQWAGISAALVRAARGEPDAAIAELEKVGLDPERDGHSKVEAVDALIHLRGYQAARKVAAAAFDEAEKSGDFHYGLEMGQRLGHVLEKLEDKAGVRLLAPRLEAMAKAHEHAHPHHHH